MFLEEKIAIDVAKYHEEERASERSKLLSNIYYNLIALGHIILRKMYGDLQEDACENLSHEAASDVVIRISNGKLGDIEKWHPYLKQVIRGKASDWFSANTYHDIYSKCSDDDVDEAYVVSNSRSNLPMFSVMLPQAVKAAANKCHSLIYLVSYETKIKRNFIFNLAVISVSEDIEDVLLTLDVLTRARVRLIKHMIIRELRIVYNELASD
jgi:hypothetical protein